MGLSMEARDPMPRRLLIAPFAVWALLLSAPGGAVGREVFPHEFKHNNMGYCAPYLAQLRLRDGSAVRPWINHLVRDLTAAGLFEGQKNIGDLYSDRARSETDQECLPRS